MAVPLTSFSSIVDIHEEATGDEDDSVHSRAPITRVLSHRKLAVIVGLVIASVAIVATVLAGQKSAIHSDTSHLDTSDLFFSDPDQPQIQFWNPIRNNLGGQGSEGIDYPGVYTKPGFPPQGLLLHVNAKHANIATDKQHNGVDDNLLGRITVMAGTRAMMTFRFVDAKTQQPATIPELDISFFDLDTHADGNAAEYVKLNGLHEYFLTEQSNIVAEDGGNESVTFKAKRRETDPNDSPEDPLLLTVQQKHKTVTAKYINVDKFDVEIGAIGGNASHGYRWINFAFKPSLLSAKTKNGPDPKIQKFGKNCLFVIQSIGFCFPWFF